MITDDDLVPFEFSDFFDDEDGEDAGDAPSSQTIEPDYIKRHIQRIPHYGDDSRYRLASHLDMFENLNPNGTLTPEQRQAVDNFAIGYQALPEEESEGCEMDFPESQYVAVGLDLESAQQLGDTYRAGKSIPQIGHEVADRISNRLNQMQSQRYPLQK